MKGELGYSAPDPAGARLTTTLPRPALVLDRPLRRSDFELQAFRNSDNGKATLQLLNTLLPTALLWWAASHLLGGTALELLALVPILGLLVLLSSRSFSLMHDCGHQSLFASRWANQAAGFLLGCLNAIPQHPWSRGHAFHHRHNGNWERYRGPSALLTCEQFQALSARGQWFYGLSRHPLMLFPGGFFYLIIKPRLQLLLGSLEYLGAVLRHLAQRGPAGLLELRSFTAAFRSSHWYTAAEYADLLANNIVVISSWVLMGRWLGHGAFWLCYSTVMTCSAAIFICIFFVQHNYETTYASGTKGWSNLEAAIHGSSNLVMPDLLHWFSADIAFHSIHHLCETIPNYRLRACHDHNASLLKGSKRLSLQDIPSCFRFILWDDVGLRLRSIAELRQSA